MMKIYFAGSIRGGRQKADDYKKIIDILSAHGQVLTEHVGSSEVSQSGEEIKESQIYERDIAWINDADVVVAEVTIASLGVGYEIGYAESKGKKIICLFNLVEGGPVRTSAMIGGNRNVEVVTYKNLETLQVQLKDYVTYL